MSIDRLPQGPRLPPRSSRMAPGANDESRSGGLSIDGASAAENKSGIWTASTPRTCGPASPRRPFLTEFVEEVQVKSSGLPGRVRRRHRRWRRQRTFPPRAAPTQFRGEARRLTSTTMRRTATSGAERRAWHGRYGAAAGSGLGRGSPPEPPESRRALRLLLSAAPTRRRPSSIQKDDYSRCDPHFQVGGPIVRNRALVLGRSTPRRSRDTDRARSRFASNGPDGHLRQQGDDAEHGRQRDLAGGRRA